MAENNAGEHPNFLEELFGHVRVAWGNNKITNAQPKPEGEVRAMMVDGKEVEIHPGDDAWAEMGGRPLAQSGNPTKA